MLDPESEVQFALFSCQRATSTSCGQVIRTSPQGQGQVQGSGVWV